MQAETYSRLAQGAPVTNKHELEFFSQKLHNCRFYGNNDVSYFSFKVILHEKNSGDPYFYFSKCFRLLYRVTLSILKKFYRTKKQLL